MEYNFHLAKTNAFNNLKNQNVHSSRHINQYYNDYYYEMIEKEEEDIESSQNRNAIDNLLGMVLMLTNNLVQFQNFKFPDFSTLSSSSPRLYLNRFVSLDHVLF